MKKRVLLVSCEGLGNGGVQAIMMGIVRKLHSEYHFDMLLFTSEKRYYDDEFLSYGGNIFRVPKYEGDNYFLRHLDYYIRDIYTYFETKRILENEIPYDIIHCNREFENAPLLFLASRLGIPVRISHAHIIHQNTNIICSILEEARSKFIKKYATRLIGCSIQACESLYGSTCNRFEVINNFYDDQKFSKDLFEYKADSELVISQVGAISNIKNQSFSIDVLSCLRRKGIQARMKIIGFEMDKLYKSGLFEKIKNNELTEYISFLPGDSNIPKELNESNCYIMPSLHEGFGIALIEAQAMGLQCFASSHIPLTTDCGNVQYLSIESGPEVWSDAITNWYLKTAGIKVECNTDPFKISNIMNLYREIYNS